MLTRVLLFMACRLAWPQQLRETVGSDSPLAISAGQSLAELAAASGEFRLLLLTMRERWSSLTGVTAGAEVTPEEEGPAPALAEEEGGGGAEGCREEEFFDFSPLSDDTKSKARLFGTLASLGRSPGGGEEGPQGLDESTAPWTAAGAPPMACISPPPSATPAFAGSSST